MPAPEKNKKFTGNNSGKHPQKTKLQPITNFFKANLQAMQSNNTCLQPKDKQESDSNSLQYSASDCSTNTKHNLHIQPAITIRRNKDIDSLVNRQGETTNYHGKDAHQRYSQIKLTASTSSNLPFGMTSTNPGMDKQFYSIKLTE
jgi:hypothetical protein